MSLQNGSDFVETYVKAYYGKLGTGIQPWSLVDAVVRCMAVKKETALGYVELALSQGKIKNSNSGYVPKD